MTGIESELVGYKIIEILKTSLKKMWNSKEFKAFTEIYRNCGSAKLRRDYFLDFFSYSGKTKWKHMSLIWLLVIYK